MIFDIHKIHPHRANSSAEFAALKRLICTVHSPHFPRHHRRNYHRPSQRLPTLTGQNTWLIYNVGSRFGVVTARFAHGQSRSAVLSEWWAFLLTLHRTRGRRKPQELAHPAFKNGTQDGEAGVMSITAQPATYSGESLSCLHLMHLELVVSEPGKPRTAPACNFLHLHPRARWLAAKDTASAAAFFMALSMSCLSVQTFPKHLVSSDRIGSYTRIE